MNQKKIAFLIPSLGAGGAERVVTTLANYLAKDFDVAIITFKKVNPFYKLDEKIQIFNCVETTRPSANVFIALKSNYILYRRINSIVKREKIELLIGFLTSANILSVLASKYNRIPCIISERINPAKTNTPKIWKFLRRLCYPKATYLVVQTEEIKDYYKAKIKNERLVILPNPISAGLSALREENPEKENIILNVGRLTYQKAQDVLIKAFAKTENKSWKLLIAGEGPKREEYEALIAQMGLTDKISLIGKTKNISDYYNKSKIFAFTSIFEGFPNALIEAMHYGLACVSTDCPTGPSELIADGSNGYLIPMNDENTLALKLDELMKDEEKITKYGVNARLAVERFKVSRVIENWNEIILSSFK